MTDKTVTTDRALPIGCTVTIIPTIDKLTIQGGSWTVMNWVGGGGPSPVYTVNKAYREITLRVINFVWDEKYYTLSSR